MFKETITGFLTYFSTYGIFWLLAFLEELGDFFETGISFLLLLFSFLDIVKEQFVCLIVDFLCRALWFGIDVAFESVNPVDFLFGHSNCIYILFNRLYNHEFIT